VNTELPLHVHIHLHSPESRPGDPVIQKLDRILAIVRNLMRGVTHMSIELDTLIEKVSAIETVADAAIALLNEIKEKLDEAIATNDPAALIELSERLGAQTDELAAAIAANTDAA
jgi:hypothetical protein